MKVNELKKILDELVEKGLGDFYIRGDEVSTEDGGFEISTSDLSVYGGEKGNFTLDGKEF